MEKLGKEAAEVLEKNEEVEGIGGGGKEVEVFIEAAGAFVHGVDGEGADADDVGGLQGAEQCVAQKGLADAQALPTMVDGKACEQHDGDGMASQAFFDAIRGLVGGDVSRSEGVITNDGRADEADVGLRRSGLLILQSEAGKVAVEFGASAVKGIDKMIGTKFFDEACFGHFDVLASKKPGAFSRRRKRGSGRGAASSAARNFLH